MPATGSAFGQSSFVGGTPLMESAAGRPAAIGNPYAPTRIKYGCAASIGTLVTAASRKGPESSSQLRMGATVVNGQAEPS